MRYYIETGRVVGLTEDLTERQATKFFSWAEKKNTRILVLDGLDGQALVVFAEADSHAATLADAKPKSKEKLEKEAGCVGWDSGDAKLWDNFKRLDNHFDKYHYVALVKIYPESVVPDDVPDDFIEKELIRYEDLKDLENREKRKPVIADYLRAAERIRGLYKDNPTEKQEEATKETDDDTLGKLPCNDARDKRLYEESLITEQTWEEIADRVNKEFPGEQLDAKSAEAAATRHQERHELLPRPRRKPGRKPKG